MITRDLTGQLYEGSTIPRDVIQDVTNFGDVGLLCKLIEDGDPLLWGDKRARDFIAKIIRSGKGLQRGSGKRAGTNLIKARRDDWIIGRLCHWKGFGLPLYSSDREKLHTACTVVAGELERLPAEYEWPPLDVDSVINLWKKHKPKPHTEIETPIQPDILDYEEAEPIEEVEPIYTEGIWNLQNHWGRMLRDAALNDPSLREKIKQEFCFDVDRILGDSK